MAKTKTKPVTVRLPIGMVDYIERMVKTGMYSSTSDYIKSIIARQATYVEMANGSENAVPQGTAEQSVDSPGNTA